MEKGTALCFFDIGRWLNLPWNRGWERNCLYEKSDSAKVRRLT